MVKGLVHAAHAPPSSWHSNVLVVAPVKVNVLCVFEVDGATEPPAGAGGVPVYTVQLRVATGPALPAASARRTPHECAPSARPVSASGEVQGAHAAESSLHS